ncbi:glycine cleavage system protein GcvH [Streptomyces sp. NPDC002994]|uniref:glycine cleavage system protein GcvH n=1 Tax=Streptomyces sp. NPDC002994 TaxID=3154441 RepID=UPI0033B08D23
MTNIPENRKYTSEHEWVETRSGGSVRVGITDFAQKQLGDIVFAEQPKVGDRFDAGEPFGSVESVKSVTEVYMPMAGRVTARNDRLSDEPELMNDQPYDDGWLIEISPENPSPDGLMSATEYDAWITSAD